MSTAKWRTVAWITLWVVLAFLLRKSYGEETSTLYVIAVAGLLTWITRIIWYIFLEGNDGRDAPGRLVMEQWATFLTPVMMTWVFMIPMLVSAGESYLGIILLVLLTPVVWFVIFFSASKTYTFWGQVGDNRWMIVLQGDRLNRIVLNSTLYKFANGDSNEDHWKLAALEKNSTPVTPYSNIFERFGMYWIGIPGFFKAKENIIRTRRVNPDRNKGDKTTTWEQCESIEYAPSIFFLHGWEVMETEVLAADRGEGETDKMDIEKKSGMTTGSGKIFLNVTNQGHFLVENPYIFSYGSEPEEVISKVEPMIMATDSGVLRKMTFKQVSESQSEGLQEMLTDKELEDADEKTLSYGQNLRKLLNLKSSLLRFGVRVLDIDFIEFELSDSEQEDALKNIEKERLNAEARAEKAKGEAAEIREVGYAEADVRAKKLGVEATGRGKLMRSMKGSEAAVVAHLQSEAVAIAGGEGANNTRPNVISFGTSGLVNTLDAGRYTGIEKPVASPTHVSPEKKKRAKRKPKTTKP